MLDFRHETFLTLCKMRSYTRTADALHITQPAVTQHVQYLEKLYGGKLFLYQNRTLHLTPRGERLYQFALVMRADTERMRELLRLGEAQAPPLRFGATLSIGEFVMPEILARLLADYPGLHVTMPVVNTQVLLQKLRDGDIDFALVEGYFDRSQYAAELLSAEEFVAVCGPAHHLAGKEAKLDELLRERIILRERGSGTREIFEHMLGEHNLSVESVGSVCEIGNMGAIKQLVSANRGITFLYRAAAAREIERGELVAVPIDGVEIRHDFSFVQLRDSVHHAENRTWLEYFRRVRRECDTRAGDGPTG